MPQLNLKPTHKPIKDYYATLQQFTDQQITHEGAVSAPFGTLMDHCAKQIDATFSQQFTMTTNSGNRIVIEGAVTKLGLPLAYWEAKDIHDDLPQAVQQKRQAGYPLNNILFQTPEAVSSYRTDRQHWTSTSPTKTTSLTHSNGCSPTQRLFTRIGNVPLRTSKHASPNSLPR